MKIREKFPIYNSKITLKRHVNLLMIEKKTNLTISLSKILALHHNRIFFDVIACNLLLLQNYQKDMVAIVRKLIVNRLLKMTKKGETVKFKKTIGER